MGVSLREPLPEYIERTVRGEKGLQIATENALPIPPSPLRGFPSRGHIPRAGALG